MRLVVYTSEQYFSQDIFGPEAIVKTSKFYMRQIDPETPAYIEAYIKENHVEDEHSFLQVGNQDEYLFYQMELGETTSSSWTDFPKLYKFISFEINMHLDRVNWNRQTYSFLNWLGDVGGLADALRYICQAFVTAFSGFSLRVTLARYFFKISESSESMKKGYNRTKLG